MWRKSTCAAILMKRLWSELWDFAIAIQIARQVPFAVNIDDVIMVQKSAVRWPETLSSCADNES